MTKVAIIGFCINVPNSPNADLFWDNLINGRECLKCYKRAELDPEHLNSGMVDARDYVPVAGVLDKADCFDASFFQISPNEALEMDPQQRKFLEASWHALEHAGYWPRSISLPVGVFAAEGLNTYLLSNIIDNGNWEEENRESAIYGCGYDYLATRVSYHLNLKGPSYTVATGCSSSLTAVHLAYESLLTYQCDMALAGGVSIVPPLHAGYIYRQGSILSPDGKCRPFDAKAEGTVFSHGLGVVVLKRLEDAIKDKNSIYAVICGSAINNDGNDKMSYAAPSVSGQRQVIESALHFSGVHPEEIGFVECHGTGTKIGDPLEIKALTAAFASFTSKKQFCPIGSLKGNFGHLNAASGVIGLLKTAFMLYHQTIVPTVNYSEPNPEIDFVNSPFWVNRLTQSVKINKAGISSFGIGGTNVHMILERETAALKPTSLPLTSFREDKYWLNEKKSSKNEKNTDLTKWFYTTDWRPAQIIRDEIKGKNFFLYADKSGYCDIYKKFLEQKGGIVVGDFSMCDYLMHFGLCDNGSFDEVQQNGLFSIVALVQALTEKQTSTTMITVGRGLFDVKRGEKNSPEKSTVLGATKVVPKEYPRVKTRTVCIGDITVDAFMQNDSLKENIMHCGEESALRDEKVWVRTYVSIPLEDDGSFHISPGVYVITGGLGHFGLDMAEFISRHQKEAILLLLGRHSLDPDSSKAKRVMALPSAHIYTVDVADRKAMAEVLDAARGFGPLKGIIHAAGVVESSILDRKTPQAFDTIFSAKIHGTQNIVSLTKGDPLDFLMLCSSMNALIGGLGQADNTAANAFVDAYAESVHFQGLNYVFSLNWGAVNQSRPREFVSLNEFQDLSREHVKNRMTDDEREKVFRLLLATSHLCPRRIISTIDLDTVIKKWNQVADFSHLTKDRKVSLKSRDNVKNLPSYVAPSCRLEESLADIWKEILGLKPIGVKDDFFLLGGHSLSAIRVVGKIKELYELSLHAMILYECPTIETLSNHIKEVRNDLSRI